MAFYFWGPAARGGLHPLISMLGAGKAAPAQFPAAGREFTRHSARGPEGPLERMTRFRTRCLHPKRGVTAFYEIHLPLQMDFFFLDSGRQRRPPPQGSRAHPVRPYETNITAGRPHPPRCARHLALSPLRADEDIGPYEWCGPCRARLAPTSPYRPPPLRHRLRRCHLPRKGGGFFAGAYGACDDEGLGPMWPPVKPSPHRGEGGICAANDG